MRDHRLRPGQQPRRLTALGLVAVALLTGCGGEPEQPTAVAPAPTTASTSPTEELPPLGPPDFPVPAEARTQDEAGAEAFLRYYIELLNRQQTIPAGKPIRDLGPECTDCLRIAQRFDEAAEAGHRIKGGSLRITGEPGVSVSDDAAKLSFIADVDAVTTIDASGQTLSELSYEAESGLSSGLGLVWSDTVHGWLASGLTIG